MKGGLRERSGETGQICKNGFALASWPECQKYENFNIPMFLPKVLPRLLLLLSRICNRLIRFHGFGIWAARRL